MKSPSRKTVRAVVISALALAVATTASVVTLSANAAVRYALHTDRPIVGILQPMDCTDCVVVADRTDFRYTVPERAPIGLNQWNMIAVKPNYDTNYNLKATYTDGQAIGTPTDHGNRKVDYVIWLGRNGSIDLRVDRIRYAPVNGQQYQYALSAVVSENVPASGTRTKTLTFANQQRFAYAFDLYKTWNRKFKVTISMADCTDRGNGQPTAQVIYDFHVNGNTSPSTSDAGDDLNPDNDCTVSYRNTGDVTMHFVLGVFNYTTKDIKIKWEIT